MYRLAIATLALTAAPAGLSAADQPVPHAHVSSLPFQASSVLVVPDGSGPSLAAAHLAGGQLADATIGARLVDLNHFAIANFPSEDIWLQWTESPGTVGGCVDYGGYFEGGVFLADAATDADGWTEWTLPLRVNSPDINGDLLVNLSDIAVFISDIGTDAYRSDYNWDGVVDLTDIVLFIPAIGAVCP